MHCRNAGWGVSRRDGDRIEREGAKFAKQDGRGEAVHGEREGKE